MKINPAYIATKTQPILNLNLRYFVYPGLLLLIFVPPFFRGIFFAPELLTTHMFTAVIFALCCYDKLVRRETKFIGSGFDYVMVFYVLVYGFSLFGALNLREAVREALKVVNYFMVYWITVQMVTKEKNIEIILRTIYLGSVGVALVGLGAALKPINYPGAMLGSRIYSTLQYPNALAAFLTAGLIIGLVLLARNQKLLCKLLYTAGNLLLMVVILGSQSRGTWVMIPVVAAILLVGLARSYRFSVLINLVLVMGIALQVYRSILPRYTSGDNMGALKFLVLGMLMAMLAQGLYQGVLYLLERKQVSLKIKKLLGAGVIIYAFSVLLIYVVYSAQVLPSVAAQFAPTQTLERAQTIDKSNSSFRNRIDFSQVALQIALDYPVNGTGGGGWEAVYHKYMPYLLWTTEVHNNFGKVLVETGFIGLGILITLWVMFLKNLTSLRREDLGDDSWSLIWAAGAAALAMGLHSAYDFDLSIPALSIILFALLGVVEGARRVFQSDLPVKPGTTRALWITFMVGTLVAIMLFLPAYRLYAAGSSGAVGAQAILEKDWKKAETKLLEARKLDPFSAGYSGDLAQVYTVQGLMENNPAKLQKADQLAREAIRREPYNFKLRSKLVLIYLLQGKVDAAVTEAEEVLAINPLYTPSYEALAGVYLGAGKYYDTKDQKDKAKVFWQKVLKVPEQIEGKKATLAPNPPIGRKIPLEVTARLTLVKGQALYYLGDERQAREVLLIIKDNPEVKAEVKLFLEQIK